MRPNTPELARELRAAGSLQDRVNCLGGKYPKTDCWILGTGPSIVEIPTEKLKEALRDKLVVCIKQSYNLLQEATDFHVINPCSIEKYQYPNETPIKIAVSWPKANTEQWQARWDVPLVIPRCGVMKRTVCYEKNFAEWELSKTLDRPWGPGIMHEIAIFLPVHFGCKRIFTLGYDHEPTEGGHFWKPQRMKMQERIWTVPAEAQDAMREWLKSHGIEMYRIATTVGSQLAQPTMNFDEAVG